MTYFNDYDTGREFQLYTVGEHARLVGDINECCRMHGRAEGGVFYVTEYKQVIKPIEGDDGSLDIYVGTYADLKFVFDLDGVHLDNSNDTSLSPGDPWPHQKVGMGYTFNAYRDRVSFWVERDFGRERKSVSVEGELLRNLRAIKSNGGGIYVNEHGIVFAPLDIDDSDAYVGRVDLTTWFGLCE
jgi:hypothetical protein